MVNYLARNEGRPAAERRRIAFLPLGDPAVDVDRLVEGITDKADTVLFLDAFDEDQGAIISHRDRIFELMQLTRSFRKVVLTCRTQFFPRDEEIPADTGIARVGPRNLTDGPTLELWKIYLAPLDDHQVARFLAMRFPGLLKRQMRRKAIALVGRLSDLCARPMLLVNVPILLTDRRAPTTSAGMYEAIIDAWIRREGRWIPDGEALRLFSERLAFLMFEGRRERGHERLPHDEVLPLASHWGINLEGWQVTSRSFLNRDASGNYKFSHRSIMEFLVVQHAMRSGTLGVEDWTDQMDAFYSEFLAADEPRAGALFLHVVRRRIKQLVKEEGISAPEAYTRALQAVVFSDNTLRSHSTVSWFATRGGPIEGLVYIEHAVGLAFATLDAKPVQQPHPWRPPTPDEVAMFVSMLAVLDRPYSRVRNRIVLTVVDRLSISNMDAPARPPIRFLFKAALIPALAPGSLNDALVDLSDVLLVADAEHALALPSSDTAERLTEYPVAALIEDPTQGYEP